MNNGFCIASSSKGVGRIQLFLQLEIVVNLAVEADPHFAVFVRQRLLARTEIYDAKTPMAQCRTRADVYAALVRTAVNHSIRHVSDETFANGSAVKIHEAGYAAHN